MKALSISAKIQLMACVAAVASFGLLFVGLQALGGGHGSPAIWYAGLIAACIAGVLLVADVALPAFKRSERGVLAFGLVALSLFAVGCSKFFAIAEWVSELVYQ